MIRFVVFIAGLILAQSETRSAQASSSAIQVHFQSAQTALAAGDYRRAESEFAAILKLDPNRAEVHANLGTVYYAQGKFPEATASLEKARRLKPGLKGLDVFQGMSLARQNQNTAALPYLEKGFADPASAQWRLEAGLLLAGIYQQTGNIEKLVATIASLQSENPKNSEVLYLAYRVYSSLGARAVSALAKEAPESARVRQLTAELMEAEGDYAGAVMQYRRALELEPKLPGGHRALGVALMNSVNDEATRAEALREFELELKENPADAYSEYQIGELMWLANRPDEALRRFQKAVQLQPQFPDALIAAGKALAAAGRIEEALTMLRQAESLDPSNDVVHYRLAQVLQKKGDRQAAEKELAEFRRYRQAGESLRSIHREVMDKRITAQRVE